MRMLVSEMKASGGIMPRTGCRQRVSASTPSSVSAATACGGARAFGSVSGGFCASAAVDHHKAIGEELAILLLADHGSAPKMVKAIGGTIWSPNGGAVTESLVKEAQSLGLEVIPWTINNPADMERLIGWGVDGIITDYPDRLRAVLQESGLPLPPRVPAD